MKIKNKLNLSFGLMIGLIGILLILFFFFVEEIYQQNRELAFEWEELATISRLDGVLNQFVFLAGDKRVKGENKSPLIRLHSDFREVVSALHQLHFYGPRSQEKSPGHEEREGGIVEKIKRECRQLEVILNRLIELSPSRQKEINQHWREIQNLSREILSLINHFIREDYEEVNREIIAAQKAQQKSERILVVTSILIVILAMGISLVLGRSILRPIFELHQGVEHLAQKDFSHPVEINTGDEIEDLARRFNSMALELRQYYQDLETKVEEKTRLLIRSEKLANVGELAAGVAHEINNPLASIVACSEGLLDRLDKGEDMGEDLREYLDIIRNESYRCKMITKNLLDFSRSGPTQLSSISLVEVINSSVKTLRYLNSKVGEGKIEIRMAIPGEIPSIKGDFDQLKQVFFNLLKNAIDAIEDQGIVQIEIQTLPSSLKVKIEDTGQGISRENLQKIWEPFFTTKEPGEGSGLGLSVCLGILEAHGAQMDIKSEGSGQGTQVILEFDYEKED